MTKYVSQHTAMVSIMRERKYSEEQWEEAANESVCYNLRSQHFTHFTISLQTIAYVARSLM